MAFHTLIGNLKQSRGRWIAAMLGIVALSFAAHATLQGKTISVDPEKGNDENPGTAAEPYQTIQKALEEAQPGGSIQLADGIYTEDTETVRAGTAVARITIEPVSGATPIIDGDNRTFNGPRFLHSYYTLRGIEIRNTKEGVRLEGVTGIVIEDTEIHHIGNECMRVRFFSKKNTIRNNTVHDCGQKGNGEGIYVGTAPEQRQKNDDKPDESTDNTISGNEIYDVDEAIDIKEDSSKNTVASNTVHGCTDSESGCINGRADANTFTKNTSSGNRGAGFRFGGDVAKSPEGKTAHYGKNNVLRDNVARGNRQSGYKFMHGPQDVDCSNTGSDNDEGLYYFGPDVEPFETCKKNVQPPQPAEQPEQKTTPPSAPAKESPPSAPAPANASTDSPAPPPQAQEPAVATNTNASIQGPTEPPAPAVSNVAADGQAPAEDDRGLPYRVLGIIVAVIAVGAALFLAYTRRFGKPTNIQ